MIFRIPPLKMGFAVTDQEKVFFKEGELINKEKGLQIDFPMPVKSMKIALTVEGTKHYVVMLVDFIKEPELPEGDYCPECHKPFRTLELERNGGDFCKCQ